MKITRITSGLAALLLSTAALAAAPTSASIERLLDAAQARNALTAIEGQIGNSMRAATSQMMQGKEMTAADKQAMDAFFAKSQNIMREALAWDKLKPYYIKVYSESFTQEEVDKLTAFYESETGKLVTAKLPLVLQKSMENIQVLMAPMSEKLKAAGEELSAQIRANHANDPKPAK